MLFNSLSFLFFFLVVSTLYFALPHRFRWILLLGASCFFYMCFVPIYILILAVTITVDYFAGILIERTPDPAWKKGYLMMSIVSVCAILFVFKYFNFFNNNIAALANLLHWNYPIKTLRLVLPIGLSFHTFQSLSYVFEVYRGRQRGEKDFGIYSLYVMYFPQLVAGPIERPQNLLHQFKEVKHFDWQRVYNGISLSLWGLFKKVVVADSLAIYTDTIYNNSRQHTGTSLLVATYFFAIQIYCDFSGYSDIARGISRIYGIELMKNFETPYFAKSISEFWSRWHISLSTWFRDYMYIPLGGNRVPLARNMFNISVVFLVSGLWHGANWTFVIWGALHGFYYLVWRTIQPEAAGARRATPALAPVPVGLSINISTASSPRHSPSSFGRATAQDEKIETLRMDGVPAVQKAPNLTTNDVQLVTGADRITAAIPNHRNGSTAPALVPLPSSEAPISVPLESQADSALTRRVGEFASVPWVAGATSANAETVPSIVVPIPVIDPLPLQLQTNQKSVPIDPDTPKADGNGCGPEPRASVLECAGPPALLPPNECGIPSNGLVSFLTSASSRGSRARKYLRDGFLILLTFHLVLLSWVFFRAANLSTALDTLRRIAVNHGPLFWDPIIVQGVLSIVLLVVLDIFHRRTGFWDSLDRFPKWPRLAYSLALLFGIVLFGIDNGTQFIYFQF